jgi:septum formation protein
MRNIILASTSPRRKELLESIGVVFHVVPAKYDEDMTGHVDPEKVVRTFSYEKAASLQSDYPDALIIAADTIVYINETVYGKPSTLDEAKNMLVSLSGKIHTVYTGYTVLDTKTGVHKTEVSKTEIKLAELTSVNIEAYFAKVPPLDKAGAYAIQGLGGTFTEWIKGEYTNVVGLPLYSLTKTLQEFDIDLLNHNS